MRPDQGMEGERKVKRPTNRGSTLHPSLRHRVGAAAETTLLAGTFVAIWGSMGWLLLGVIAG
jgi:hypothetical protein